MTIKRKVLVLNKSWHPIAIITLRKAICHLFDTYVDGTPKAKVIDHYNDFMVLDWNEWSETSPHEDEEQISSARRSFRCPEIIQYTRYDRIPTQRRNFSKSALYKRDNYSCQYCGSKKSTQNLSVDHVLPRSQGGKTVWENVVIACKPCNARKADRTPQEAGMPLLKKPIKPNFTLITDEKLLKSWEQFLLK